MSNIAYTLALTLIQYYGPPMIANAMPVLLKTGKPIDGGRLFIDGRRILGDGKTWEGLLLGMLGGVLASIAVSVLFKAEELCIILALGSLAGMLGDIGESFIKRRLGIKRGDPLPVLDQLDFALASTALYVCTGVLSLKAEVILSLLIILVLHITTNAIAFKLGLKDKPW